MGLSQTKMLLQNNREKKHQNVKATYKKEEQSVIW